MTENWAVSGDAENRQGSLSITPAWTGLKQQIFHLAQFGGSVQVVCGAEGAGKTTFLRLLQQEASDLNFVALYDCSASGLDTLLFDMLSELGLRPNDGATVGQLIAALRGYVQNLEAESIRAVVAIDDAHELDDSSLAAVLSVLQGHQESGFGLHLILLGESGLAERIDQMQLLDISVHDALIPNFSPSELQSLLEQAVKQGRLQNTLPLEGGQSIWAQSKGLPGPALAFFDASAEETPKARSGLMPAHYVALGVLVALLCWALFSQNSERSSTTIENPASAPVKPVVISRGHEAAEPQPLPSAALNPNATATLTQPSPVLPIGAKTTRPAVGAVSGNSEAIATELNEAASYEVPSSPQAAEVAPKPRLNKPLSVALDAGEAGELNPIANAGEAANLAIEARAAPTKPLENKTAPSADAAKKAADINDRPQVQTTSANGELIRLQKTEAELLDLPSNRYVLQLMATSERSALYQHIDRQPNSSNLKVYRGLRGGSRFYILVEGFYADRGAALAAVLNLPENQQKAKPWPKKLADIQREIQQLGGK